MSEHVKIKIEVADNPNYHGKKSCIYVKEEGSEHTHGAVYMVLKNGSEMVVPIPEPWAFTRIMQLMESLLSVRDKIV